MLYHGIDVSEHNGLIEWSKVKSNIDFAIIRAGYGQNNIDKNAILNIFGCRNNGIPFGLYWFSYALSEEMARSEADYICDIADKYNPTYPLCYDWEYDSDKYAKRKEIDITNTIRERFARAFLKRVEERGYYAMLYTNIHYLDKGFSGLVSRYDVWLAQWSVSTPTEPCGIWQSSNSGKVLGISTDVDINISYRDYASSGKKTKTNQNHANKANKNKIHSESEMMEQIAKVFKYKYTKIAESVIAGEYGNGNERKKKLESLGYDYEVVQAVVNYMLK